MFLQASVVYFSPVVSDSTVNVSVHPLLHIDRCVHFTCRFIIFSSPLCQHGHFTWQFTERVCLQLNGVNRFSTWLFVLPTVKLSEQTTANEPYSRSESAWMIIHTGPINIVLFIKQCEANPIESKSFSARGSLNLIWWGEEAEGLPGLCFGLWVLKGIAFIQQSLLS